MHTFGSGSLDLGLPQREVLARVVGLNGKIEAEFCVLEPAELLERDGTPELSLGSPAAIATVDSEDDGELRVLEGFVVALHAGEGGGAADVVVDGPWRLIDGRGVESESVVWEMAG